MDFLAATDVGKFPPKHVEERGHEECGQKECGHEEADRQANLARDASGSTVIERPYTSASNRARRISEGRSAAKAKWEADRCSKHFSYRLKGKAGTKRPIPMTSVKLLAARFYRLKSGHAPT
jgi:transposase-like protein